MKIYSRTQFTFFMAICLIVMILAPKIMALEIIPGLTGFGTDTRGAFGATNYPEICIVTDLTNENNGVSNSTRNSIPVKTGSLIECINYTPPRGSGKIILFEISGTIHATSSPYTYNIDDPYTTIIGQSAPFPGISLRNIMMQVRTHDVVIQHLRIRVGDAVEGVNPDYRRAFSITDQTLGNELYNIVVDHCSFSWGIDVVVLAAAKYGSGNVHDITYSNCIISEGLNNSLHTKGPHAKGIAIQIDTENIMLIQNLIAHSVDRNPYIRRGSSAVINNLIYNTKDFNAIIAIAKDEELHSSIVGNVIKGGPNSGTTAQTLIPTFWESLPTSSRIYINDNRTEAGTQKSADDWSLVRWAGGLSDLSRYVKILEPKIWSTGLIAMKSSKVEEFVIDNVGARPAERDAVDTRIVGDVIHRSGRIIDTPYQVGGWPNLEKNRTTHSLPNNPFGDSDGDGYTNIEEWFHEMASKVEELVSRPDDLAIKNITQ